VELAPARDLIVEHGELPEFGARVIGQGELRIVSGPVAPNPERAHEPRLGCRFKARVDVDRGGRVAPRHASRGERYVVTPVRDLERFRRKAVLGA
jgi:hypothetical protein